MDEHQPPTLEDLKARMEMAKTDLPYMDAETRQEVKAAIFWMNLFISEITPQEVA